MWEQNNTHFTEETLIQIQRNIPNVKGSGKTF